MMSSDEVIRKYNAQPLDELLHSVAIININKKYKIIRDEALQVNTKYLGKDLIYESVKQAWVMGARRETVDYVLAEYRGIIVEVYEVIEVKNNEGSLERWYKVPGYKNRWGFNGRRATDNVRDYYLNKSILHHKKRGAANPIRYSL